MQLEDDILKVEIECLSCIIHRGYLEIAESSKDPKLQFKLASKLLDYLSKEFTPNAVAAILGTTRDRIIKQISGNPDIYKEKKKLSNKKALALLPQLKNAIENEATPGQKFRKATLAAIVGNIIEFHIPKHKVNFDQLSKQIADAEKDLAIDDISEIFEEAKNARSILYLTDNAGEIALDKLLVEELRKLGSKIIVAVKDGPILNDATLEDAQAVNMFNLANKVITTGADAIGLPIPRERSKEFEDNYSQADLVIAKGMGYAESLTEESLKQPHALLLRTKCSPVARYFGVPKDKNVAKLMK
jgi:uncharacterized protein with ATP-grasp and redox domains